MNVTLTLDFDSMEDLQKFVATKATGPVVSSASLEKLKAVPDIVEATVAAAAAVDLTPEPVIDPLSDAPVAEVVDLKQYRVDLMSKLKTLAGSMPDPAMLGKFINSFDVARFSELPDDRLVSFSNALQSEYGV